MSSANFPKDSRDLRDHYGNIHVSMEANILPPCTNLTPRWSLMLLNLKFLVASPLIWKVLVESTDPGSGTTRSATLPSSPITNKRFSAKWLASCSCCTAHEIEM